MALTALDNFIVHRIDAIDRICEWENCGFDEALSKFQALLGRRDNNFSDDDDRLCAALAGEHGYAVYKALLARGRK